MIMGEAIVVTARWAGWLFIELTCG